MGLGDYFRRRRAKESALPEGMETAPPSASDGGSPPGGFAPLPGDSVHGAPTAAPAGGGMVQQMMALQILKNHGLLPQNVQVN